jgi:hypothetical protein
MLIPHNSMFIFCVLEEKELISTARDFTVFPTICSFPNMSVGRSGGGFPPRSLQKWKWEKIE